MHTSRIAALVGVIVGIIGLTWKSLDTDGEALLPQLSQANDAFPDGIPTIWGGLDTWAQVVVVIFIVVVVVLAVRPPLRAGLDRVSSMTVATIGLLLFIYAIVKWVDAGGKADDLEAAFGQAAQAQLIPAAFPVSVISIGFILLLIGTGIVAAAGAMGLRTRTAPPAG